MSDNKSSQILEFLKAGTVLKTVNGYGFVSLKVLPELIDGLAMMSLSRPVLDIGCGHGITSKFMLSKGFDVIANDLAAEHLDALLGDVAADETASKLRTLPGNVLDAVTLDNESLSGVVAINVIHFLKGPEVRVLFERVFKWLAHGGVFVVQANVPEYLGKQATVEFYTRMSEGVEWPGEFATKQVLPNLREMDLMPEFVNVLSSEIMIREALNVGFRVFKCTHISSKYMAAANRDEIILCCLTLTKD